MTCMIYSSKLAYRHLQFFSMLDRANLAQKIIINDVPIMSIAEKAIAIVKI